VIDRLIQLFPGLAQHGYRVISPATTRYNCIAWAASRDDRWWWPTVYAYWPPGAPQGVTLAAFEATFETLGYRRCGDGALELCFEKIAIYATPAGRPTHAARQLDSGKWTSKLGQGVDIQHASAEALNEAQYGWVVMFMRRPRPIWRWPSVLLHRCYGWFTRRS
jgi:hypothetical protein